MVRRSRWQTYVDAATGGMAGPAVPPGYPRGLPGTVRASGPPSRGKGGNDRLWSLVLPERGSSGNLELLRRTDLRLVPSAALVWAATAAGYHLQPGGLALLCIILAAASGLLLLASSNETAVSYTHLTLPTTPYV